jgi:hypothetical protein
MTDPYCNYLSDRLRCSALCWLFCGCVVQRDDACFQSRRWLFESVRTHRRHTQAVNGARSRSVCAQAFPGSNPGGGMPATVPARDFAGLGSLAEPGWPMTSSPTFESWSRDSRRSVRWSYSQSPLTVSGPESRTADSGRRFTVIGETFVVRSPPGRMV